MSITKTTKLLLALAPLVLLLALGCSKADGAPGYGSTEVIFKMGVSGQDYSVFLDGRSIGRVNGKDETISQDIDSGDHSFYVHDNINNRTSESMDFNVASGQTLIYTFGSGNLTLHWK